MKKIICLIFLSLSTTVFSNPYPSIFVNVTPTTVIANVQNTHDRSITCRGNVFGSTSYGNYLQNYMFSVIPPFGRASQYVHSNYNDPFIRGSANIFCQWW